MLGLSLSELVRSVLGRNGVRALPDELIAEVRAARIPVSAVQRWVCSRKTAGGGSRPSCSVRARSAPPWGPAGAEARAGHGDGRMRRCCDSPCAITLSAR